MTNSPWRVTAVSALIISLEHHFRDSIPDEWYELKDPTEINAVFDLLPKMIDDVDIIVDYPFENMESQDVANSAWNLYSTICDTYKIEEE